MAVPLFMKNTGFGKKVSNVTALQALEIIREPGAVALDVRTPQEFASGHLKGARHIPLSELGSRAGELPSKDGPILVYCHAGSRSMQACGILSNQGFSNAHNLSGGITAWQQQGHEVVR